MEIKCTLLSRLILPVSMHHITQLPRKLLTVTLLPERCRELSMVLTQMKTEFWPLKGLKPSWSTLACRNAVASVPRGFWAVPLMGTLITGLSFTFNTILSTVPVTVSGNITRLWGNTHRHNMINSAGKQCRLPYRNGCQFESHLCVNPRMRFTEADSLHIRTCSNLQYIAHLCECINESYLHSCY